MYEVVEDSPTPLVASLPPVDISVVVVKLEVVASPVREVLPVEDDGVLMVVIELVVGVMLAVTVDDN